MTNRTRKIIRALHRDVGYFLTGLVILYCVSGIAVNHIDDWNPSYSTSVRDVELGALAKDGADPFETLGLDGLEGEVVRRLDLDPGDVQGRRRSSPTGFVVFLPDGGEAKLNALTGKGSLKLVSTRPGLFQANVLHLNHLKGAWTWVADIFSVLLIGLAISGLMMLKAKNGFLGRGKWFFAAGLLVPIVALVFYYASRGA